MEINDRLFSETSDYVLYSVLMDETEYSIYSEFIESLYSEEQHEDEDEDEPNTLKIAKAAGIGGAAAIVGGAATVGGAKLYQSIPNTPAWNTAKKGALVAGTLGTTAALVDVYGRKHFFKKKKNKK